MKFPVRTPNSVKLISIDFAEELPDEVFGAWAAALDSRSNSIQHDTVEFLESAISKLSLYRRKERVVRSIAHLSARIKQNAEGELLGVLIASARWLMDGAVASFCQFRRTWRHNIAFDFLGVHPMFLTTGQREVSGIGTALLCGISLIAEKIGAELVWAETTDTSAKFYSRLFDIPDLGDLLVLSSADFHAPLKAAVEYLG